MGSRQLVSLALVFEMLDTCAPTSQRTQKLHHWWVWNGSLCYQGLPTGDHGSKRAHIETGHVRKMVRRLEIDRECAGKIIPGLWGS